MSKEDVSRRCVLGALSVGAAGAAASAVPFQAREHATGHFDPPSDSVTESTPTSSPGLSAADICAPLVTGSTLGHWTVEELLPVRDGAATVVLSDAAGGRFQVDICARDDSPDACRGPGRTEHFDLFVANRGDGNTSTREDHGLAAMALAEVVRANEHGLDQSEFRTLRQRIVDDAVRLVVT